MAATLSQILSQGSVTKTLFLYIKKSYTCIHKEKTNLSVFSEKVRGTVLWMLLAGPAAATANSVCSRERISKGEAPDHQTDSKVQGIITVFFFNKAHAF